MATINFESSQYVDVEFSLASAGQRLLAAFIDAAIFLTYFIVLFSFTYNNFFYSGGSAYVIMITLAMKLPWILYNPICEYFMKGQTVGKYLVGIQVVTLDGEPPRLKEIFTRWIFKGDFIWISGSALAFMWLALGVIGTLIVSLTKNNQRIADILAGTIHIQVKRTDKFNLKDVLAIKDSSNYEVKYPQVIRFTDEDMMLIKNTIIRLRNNPSPETIQFGKELSSETARIMGIDDITKNRMEFLQNVLQDYVVLTR